jgi:hypothetical protein
MARTITMLLCVLLAGPAQAAAQATSEERDTATARALFREGLELSDLGDLEGAADRFRRSLEIRPSPVVEYNLGSTLVELGRLVEASERLNHVLQHFDREPGGNERVHRAARALHERISARIARLTIEVRGFSEGDEVELDGVRHPEQALGVGAPVDPGTHRVTVERDGAELASTEIELAEGANESVVLEVIPVAPAIEPNEQIERVERRSSDPVPPVLVPEEDDSGVIESPWLWIAVTAGAAAIAMVIVIMSLTGEAESPYSGSLVPGSLEL